MVVSPCNTAAHSFALVKLVLKTPKFSQLSWHAWENNSFSLGCRFRVLRSHRALSVLANAAINEENAGIETESPSPKIVRNSRFGSLFGSNIPGWLIDRLENLGFLYPTLTQEKAIPVAIKGQDLVLQAQTGSGKTLVFLLNVISKIDPKRSAVQAIIVVPTRELGIQVARVARQLCTKRTDGEGSEDPKLTQKERISIMAILDGGNNSRQKAWLKSEPPQIVVGTPDKILKLASARALKFSAVKFLVVDEIDAVMEQTQRSDSNSLQKIIALLPTPADRQTIFCSATIAQHRHFMQLWSQNKWIKADAFHCHVEPEEAIPFFISHRFVVAEQQDKLFALGNLILSDRPRAAIVFVSEQSEKSKRAGSPPPSELVTHFLTELLKRQQKEGEVDGGDENLPLVLCDDAHVNDRTFTVQEFRDGRRRLLVATELAARGLDLPEVSHVYNYDLPSHVTSYVHRAGRTGRRPVEQEEGVVTTIVPKKEVFALRRIESQIRAEFNELQTPSRDG